MPKYRKKPVEVEAVKYTGSSTQRAAIREWMSGGEYRHPVIQTMDLGPLDVETLGVAMTARPGDYIVSDGLGGFYPCDPAAFERAYQPVD